MQSHSRYAMHNLHRVLCAVGTPPCCCSCWASVLWRRATIFQLGLHTRLCAELVLCRHCTWLHSMERRTARLAVHTRTPALWWGALPVRQKPHVLQSAA